MNSSVNKDFRTGVAGASDMDGLRHVDRIESNYLDYARDETMNAAAYASYRNIGLRESGKGSV
jgi:hypothetical protein